MRSFGTLTGLVMAFGGAARAASINVSVTADWPEPPLQAVILESVAKRNASAVFPLLSELVDYIEEGAASSKAPEFLLEKASQYVNNPELLEADVALGAAIPAVVAKSVGPDFMPECDHVLEIEENEFTCDVMKLYSLQSDSKNIRSMDLSHDSTIGQGPVAVLHADLSKPETLGAWHQALMAAALEGKLTYVFRHKLNPESAPTTSVSGYGLKVQLKRTDYLVIDDRSTKGKDIKLNVDAPQGKIDADAVPELGKKAAQMLDSSGSFDHAVEVISNFPNYVSTIAEEVIDNEAAFAKKFPLPAGRNVLSIDGAPFSSINAFDFLDAVETELDTVADLAKELGINRADALKALDKYLVSDRSALLHPELAWNRFDIHSDAIIWVSDIGEEVPFQSWPRDAKALLNAETGMWPQIGRNVHSLVLALDFNDALSLNTLTRVVQVLFGHSTPVQLGIVPINLDSEIAVDLTELSGNGRAAIQAYVAALLRGVGDKEAVSAALEEDEDPRAVKAADATEWLERFDIHEPTLFANGVALPLSQWQMTAMEIFDHDTRYLQQMVEQGEIREEDTETNLRDLILAMGAPRRSAVVTPLGDPEYVQYPPFLSGLQFVSVNGDSGDIAIVSSFATRDTFSAIARTLRLLSKDAIRSVSVYPTSSAPVELAALLLKQDAAANLELLRNSKTGDRFFASKIPAIKELTEEEIQYATEKLAVAPKQEHVIVNGRLVADGLANVKLFPKIAAKELERRQQLFRDDSPSIARVREAAALKAVSIGRVPFNWLRHSKPNVHASGKEDMPSILVVIDPASDEGQEMLALAKFGHELGLSVDVYFAPGECKTIPNRLFATRYPSTLSQATEGGLTIGNLDPDTLYTVGIVEPPAWVVTARESYQDLDNVILNTETDGHNDLKAQYTLKSLLVEGHNIMPHIQLTLRNGSGFVGDTMVMENLGYYQLQAPKPAFYRVCSKYHCVPAVVDSMNPQPLRTKFSDNDHKEEDEEDDEDKNSFGGRLRGLWSRVAKRTTDDEVQVQMSENNAPVNIFTVASGHLYERFASLMMLSVMRHAKHLPVKFWLIENFMSPSFKQFLPYLAEKRGFEYEMVTFKWPQWLRHQTEKQREIWGYKILFLDVLFPQNLHKVIFVDSDQIVRTDMKELVDVDLQGAPYGYAPMGDDRPEMEPFRFWKQGYWKKILKDKWPYHISALYVVDLDRFREMAAGDRLREHYQQLSADPGSLSNLDQDLPNNLQSKVPIHTLDRDWLWCETWCSDESLKTAKTIDLCNNPLTKEPKLDRARRQIPEWTEYDDEVAALREEFFAQQAAKSTADSEEEAAGSHDEL